MPVSEYLYNWILQALESLQYTDVQRSLRDVVDVLVEYDFLSPRTDYLPMSSQAIALLVSGTILNTSQPEQLTLWLPRIYPNESPILAVNGIIRPLRPGITLQEAVLTVLPVPSAPPAAVPAVPAPAPAPVPPPKISPEAPAPQVPPKPPLDRSNGSPKPPLPPKAHAERSTSVPPPQPPKPPLPPSQLPRGGQVPMGHASTGSQAPMVDPANYDPRVIPPQPPWQPPWQHKRQPQSSNLAAPTAQLNHMRIEEPLPEPVPDLMDTSADNSSNTPENNPQRRAALNSLEAKLEKIGSNDEVPELSEDARILEDLQRRVNEVSTALTTRKKQHEANIEMLEAHIQKARTVINKTESQLLPSTWEEFLDIKDKAIEEAKASDLAITDLLRLLPKALDAGSMELHVYLRLVRQYAREQFGHRYLLNMPPPKPPKQ